MARSNRTRIAGWGAVALLLAAGLAFAFWPRPVPVDLGVIDSGPLTVTVDDEGITRVREVYAVAAPLAGRVRRLDLDVGDVVEAGLPTVAPIQPSAPALLDERSRRQAEAEVQAARAAVGYARAERERVQAELDFLLAELDRARRLAERGTVSPVTLDRAEKEVNTAKAALDTAIAALEVRAYELEVARARLSDPAVEPGAPDACCVRVPAPADGVVLRVLQESEVQVAAGAVLVEIGDPGDLEVVVDLLSSEAVGVEPGAPATLTGWGGPQPLAARVRRVEPFGFTRVSALGIEEQRVNVILDLAAPPAERARLGHGFRVDAHIVVWHADAVPRAPLAALFREREGRAAFGVADGRARPRRVGIGRADGRLAQVTDGLSPGETVVLYPGDHIADGTRVAARDAP